MNEFRPGNVVLLRGESIGIVVERPDEFKTLDTGQGAVWACWWNFDEKGKWSTPLYVSPRNIEWIGHFTDKDLTDFRF